MEGIAGVFTSRAAAENAVRELRQTVSDDAIILLTPEASPEQVSAELEEVPTTEAERPGIGKAITGVVGAAIGSGAGLGIGSAAASLAVPGVGTIFAVGIGAAAVLGLTGAAIGAKVGEKEEAYLDTGVPRDDIGCYRELLRQGRSLVIAEADSPHRLDELRGIILRHGGERFEDARKRLQSGCQDAA
jgi:hypothetical protein